MYFIRENKARCALLIFMLFLGYAAYLGGLYVTNPLDNWQLPMDYYEKFTSVYPVSDDEDYSDFRAFTETLADNDQVDVLPMGVSNFFNWESIMAFETGTFSITFLSVEDFKTYCTHMNIECSFDNLKSGSLIMSDRFAKNRGLEIGDTVDEDFSDAIYGEFTLDAVTKEDGYTLYFIDGDAGSVTPVLILGNGMEGQEFYSYLYSVQAQYNVLIHDMMRPEIEGEFETFYMIYLFILVLMAVILAVTINAAFVGMYQRRNPEFAVYRAIGISKARIIGKITGELLCMDGIALAAGGAVFFFALYLFNNLVLYPVGKYLRYFHPMALGGLLLCNLAVLIPLIVTRSRQMLKADICEY